MSEEERDAIRMAKVLKREAHGGFRIVLKTGHPLGYETVGKYTFDPSDVTYEEAQASMSIPATEEQLERLRQRLEALGCLPVKPKEKPKPEWGWAPGHEPLAHRNPENLLVREPGDTGVADLRARGNIRACETSPTPSPRFRS
jgi:hypothetical protein